MSPRRQRLLLCFLTALSLTFLATAQTGAQTAFASSQPRYGGQLVQEFVPYQPSVLYDCPQADCAPVYLDSMPEFNQLGDVYQEGSALLEQSAQPTAEQIPPGFRKGLFQKLFFTGTYIPQLDNDSLGFSELETGVVFGVPFFRVTAPLLITPRFAVNYLDRPAGLDLPNRLYDAEVSFRHLRKFGEGPWAMNAAVTLGEYSDFERSDADAFRVTGQAFAVYTSSTATQWIFGVVYLNRQDISVVPALGLIYTPTPDIKYEAIFPRPRIAWRLLRASRGDGNECWAYVGGELGGGVWSIQRTATFTQDLLTSNDYRILVGVERKVVGGLSPRVELGYVFGRELEFSSGTPDVRLDDSLFVRGGLSY